VTVENQASNELVAARFDAAGIANQVKWAQASAAACPWATTTPDGNRAIGRFGLK